MTSTILMPDRAVAVDLPLKGSWPASFAQWPVGDQIAQEAWFRKDRNLDFSFWKALTARKAGKWQDLDFAIAVVLNITEGELSEWRKIAYDTWIAGAAISTKEHITNTDKVEIARQFIVYLKGQLSQTWSDNKDNWARTCFEVYAARMNLLWKQKKNRDEKTEKDKRAAAREEEDTQDDDNGVISDSAKVDETRPLGTEGGSMGPPRGRSPRKSGTLFAQIALPLAKTLAKTPSRSRRQTTAPGKLAPARYSPFGSGAATPLSRGGVKSSETESDSHSGPERDRMNPSKRRITESAIHTARGLFADELSERMHKATLKTVLIQRNIVVLLKGGAFTELDVVTIGVGALVAEEWDFAEVQDIRADHLSWKKFCDTLNDTDPRCVVGIPDLYGDEDRVVVSYELPAQVGTVKEVVDEEGFRQAIGLLEYYAGMGEWGQDLTFTARWS